MALREVFGQTSSSSSSSHPRYHSFSITTSPSNLSSSYSSTSSNDSWELSIGNLGVHDYHFTQVTDRLTSTLRCAEMLSDSPSTSSENAAQLFNPNGQRRRSARGVLQPVQPPPEPIARPLCQAKRRSLDQRLNTPQHASIRTAVLDRGIHGNKLGFVNLLKAEEDTGVNSHYFEAIQDELEVKHREQAVDWLFDVSKDCHADPGVLPLAVSLMDRFLSIQQIYKKDIQALAGTCFFIASKMKEPQPLNARKMSDYTVNTVSVGNILSWELLICSQLEWDISSPTGVDFFDFISANYPNLSILRGSYLEILHRMQRCIF
ncbi:unnamed protein product, partial [Mesorhabditis belari]|uniref:Cyclin-like domain-containing protein n=1 Tax=Mesorhabditis belari TaxID=2138241 RepID=A0AAF3EWM6_9BILA